MPDPPNATIASLFDELADLYELDGAVVHRVVAYRNAAKSVREAPRSVAAMTRDGKVTELPGIGRTLEEKIEALIETGTIPAVEKLRARIPAGLIDLTRLPGLGPKRARRLYDELGIDSLESLRAAAEEQRLRDVRGFGAKFEEAVLDAFAAGAGEAPKPKVLLNKALDIGEGIVAALRAHPASDRVELAGSARRTHELRVDAVVHDAPGVDGCHDQTEKASGRNLVDAELGGGGGVADGKELAVVREEEPDYAAAAMRLQDLPDLGSVRGASDADPAVIQSCRD